MNRTQRTLGIGACTALALTLTACGGSSGGSPHVTRAGARSTATAPFATDAVAAALQASVSKEQGGVYQAAIPRDDLHIKRGSLALEPSFDQESEIDFLPETGGQTLVTGELATTEPEQAALVPALVAEGIDVTAIHNHVTELTPEIQWVHFMATGDAVAIAKQLRSALQRTTHTSFPVADSAKTTSLPASALAGTLGGQAKTEDGGVVTVAVDRGDRIVMGSTSLPSDLGTGALVYFQPLSGGSAATTGEMCVIGSEVQPVVAALVQHKLTVTALHSHMLDTSPATYFVHWFGTGSPTTLATDMRAVLDKANYPKAG